MIAAFAIVRSAGLALASVPLSERVMAKIHLS